MMQTIAWGAPGLFEWLIIGFIGLLLFGKRLPATGRGIGEAIRNFKLGMKESAEETPTPEEPAVPKVTVRR